MLPAEWTILDDYIIFANKDNFCHIINCKIIYLPDEVNECENKSKSVQKSS